MRILLALVISAILARADTVFLKDGSKLEGKVVGVANGKIGVKTAEGKTHWIDEAAVERVEKSAAEAPPPDAAPPEGTDPAAQPPADSAQQPPKGPLKGPKCPTCKGKKKVKCTRCTDGMADVPCPECAGQGFLNCRACGGRAVFPCSCEGKNPKCPKCGGTGAGADCDACARGVINCARCSGTTTINGPCPDCKKKKMVPCPTCQGTGVDPAAAANPEGTPADPAVPPEAAPPEETAETPEEPPAEEPPAEAPEAPKMPAAALSSASVEVIFGVVDGIERTEGRKLWRISVKLTNGNELGSLVVKCGDFALRTDDGTVVKALLPKAGHPDAAPKMVGQGSTKDVRLWFETAYDRTPKTLLFTTAKWKGEPFTIELPKAK